MANLSDLKHRRELERKRLKDQGLLDEEASSRAKRIKLRKQRRGRRKTTIEVILNAGLWGAVILICFIAVAWHSSAIVNWVSKL
ncbi:MAG: hypothetical protein HOB79_15685 [Rhodospirillaceae bacterium]|nr:hypothetical protein [Rhodospirillaceae bacterium]